MLSITAVLLCAGIMDTPDLDQCVAFNDTQGPYETVAACEARLDEITETWPPMFALSMHIPEVSIFWPVTTCEIPSEPV